MTTTTENAAASTATSIWTLDPSHTSAEFAVKHMMMTTVRGRFGAVTGTIELDEEDATRSKVAAEIEAGTIDTREPKRDAHLRSADFLDAENHAHIRFVGRRIERAGEAKYRVTGDLTIRGTTKEVVLDVTDEGRRTSPWGQEVAGFTATTKIDRREWGLEWNQVLETGGVLVGNEVKITIEAEAIRQS